MEEKGTNFLTELAGTEDLAEKKIKIYARLLTNIELAKAMDGLSARHAKRKQTLLDLATGEDNHEA